MISYKNAKMFCQEELVQKCNKIKNDADFQIKVHHGQQELNAISITKRSLLTFYAKQTSSAGITNPKNLLVKIPQNSVSQSNEQVIGAKTDDSEHITSNLATSRIATAQLHLQSH